MIWDTCSHSSSQLDGSQCHHSTMERLTVTWTLGNLAATCAGDQPGDGNTNQCSSVWVCAAKRAHEKAPQQECLDVNLDYKNKKRKTIVIYSDCNCRWSVCLAQQCTHRESINSERTSAAGNQLPVADNITSANPPIEQDLTSPPRNPNPAAAI